MKEDLPLPGPRLAPMPLLASLALLVGCPSATLHELEEPVAAALDAPAGTESFVGDYVEYTYEGLAVSEPVILRQQVIAERGGQVTLEVTAWRGRDRRRWMQVQDLASDPGGQMEAATGPLLDWLRLGAESGSRILDQAPCHVDIAGWTYACTCRTGRLPWEGRQLGFVDRTCPGFEWTQGPAEYWDEDTGETILRSRITGVGNRPVRASQVASAT